MEQSTNNKRLLSLDYIRALACFLVILIHSPFSGENANGYYIASASLLGSPCNGLFFMVSGYLLLPVADETSVFLKKRLSKVLFPTLFWTFFYISVNLYNGNTSWPDLCRVILSIPFSRQGTGWLWFMYVLIGLYLAAPVISSWIKNVTEREFRLYLILCLITSFFPLLGHWLEITQGVDNVLYYFMGYIVYFLMGAYLKKYPPRCSAWIWACLYVIPIVIALTARVLEYDIIIDEFRGYLSYFTISMCLALFCLLKQYEYIYQRHGKLSSWMSDFSKCSFGIYLIHHFVSHELFDRSFLLEKYGSLLQIVFSVILTLSISYAIIWAISWLPYSEYIIGFRRTKITR